MSFQLDGGAQGQTQLSVHAISRLGAGPSALVPVSLEDNVGKWQPIEQAHKSRCFSHFAQQTHLQIL